jgi:RNA polymerase sigma factor (sigma-70 family)
MSVALQGVPYLPERIGMPASDAELLLACKAGSEQAWSTLIDKYRNLIFSIPVRYGFSKDEAADIFQAVCLDLLQDLPRLREANALPKWLIEVCSHKCYHWKRRQRHWATNCEPVSETDPDTHPDACTLLVEAEDEQLLREAIALMQPRCQRLIEMMFFEDPVPRYQEVATRLVIAPNSVPAIRHRCLDRLRKILEDRGL